MGARSISGQFLRRDALYAKRGLAIVCLSVCDVGVQ